MLVMEKYIAPLQTPLCLWNSYGKAVVVSTNGEKEQVKICGQSTNGGKEGDINDFRRNCPNAVSSPENVETVITHVTKCPASNGRDWLFPVIRTALPSVLSILFQQK